ncbi:MAG: hypothetical protein U1G07_02700 [Verrucomicrobiota bacterium]
MRTRDDMVTRSGGGVLGAALAVTFVLSTQTLARPQNPEPSRSLTVQSDAPSSIKQPTDSAQKPATPREPPWGVYSPGVADVLRLVEAKVNSGIVKAYIQNAPVAYNLTAQEIISLKDKGVSEDVVLAMLSRGGQLRAEASRVQPPAPIYGQPSVATETPVNLPHYQAAPVTYVVPEQAAQPSYYYWYSYSYPYYYPAYSYWWWTPFSYYRPFHHGWSWSHDRDHRFAWHHGNQARAFSPASQRFGNPIRSGFGGRPGWAQHSMGGPGRSFGMQRGMGQMARAGGFRGR